MGLGVVVVKNRSQDEMESNTSFEEARKIERKCLAQCEYIKNLPLECKGTDRLIDKLIELQKQSLEKSEDRVKKDI